MKTSNNKLTTLEFLIPSYKRPHTVIQAVESVAKQIEELKLSERVKITIVDDCSPNLDVDEIINAIYAFSSFVSFKQNDVNKGMSLNIRDMVANSNADFCTILTDDDRIQPNSLKEIIQTLDSLDETIGSFFVPRYSYLEDGNLLCIGCNSFDYDKKIEPSHLNSLKYLHNGFILTGLFFKPQFINLQLWDENIENSFFPVIYFADLLLNYPCLFINKNWFIHTVLNECHWDSWGTTEQARLSRLYRDYMEAVTISAKRASLKKLNFLDSISLLTEEISCYQNQIQSTLPQLIKQNRVVTKITSSRTAYYFAMINYLIKLSRHKLRVQLSKVKRKLLPLLS